MDDYFAHPYASYQRESNENTNRLIRQFFPKTEHYREMPGFPDKIARAEELPDRRPRKKLGFKTPAEVYLEELAPNVS